MVNLRQLILLYKWAIIKLLKVTSVHRSHVIPKTEFFSALKKLIEIKKEIKKHLITGDYNINLLDEDVFSQVLLETVKRDGYIPGFYEVTRPSNKNKSSCINSVLIKAAKNLNVSTFTLQNSISDHYTLFFIIKKTVIVLRLKDIQISIYQVIHW